MKLYTWKRMQIRDYLNKTHNASLKASYPQATILVNCLDKIIPLFFKEDFKFVSSYCNCKKVKHKVDVFFDYLKSKQIVQNTIPTLEERRVAKPKRIKQARVESKISN